MMHSWYQKSENPEPNQGLNANSTMFELENSDFSSRDILYENQALPKIECTLNNA